MRACITIGETELRSLIAKHVAAELRLGCVRPEHVDITAGVATVDFALGAYAEDERPVDDAAVAPGELTLAEMIQETAAIAEFDAMADEPMPIGLSPVQQIEQAQEAATEAATNAEAILGACDPAAGFPGRRPAPAPETAAAPGEISDDTDTDFAELEAAAPLDTEPFWTDERTDQALRGVKAGASEETIAANLGCDISEVYDLLDRFCPERTPREANAALKRWRVTEDLTIIRAKAAGKGAYEIASSVKGRTPADVAARLKDLLPKATPDAIEAKLAELTGLAA